MKHLLLLSAVLTSFNIFAQNPVMLKPGFTTETILKKDQKDLYQARLIKGDYLDVALVQKSVDVVIDAYDPSGKKFKTFDSPNGPSGPEPIQFVAPASGTYRFEVHPFSIDRSQQERECEKFKINLEHFDTSSFILFVVSLHTIYELGFSPATQKHICLAV